MESISDRKTSLEQQFTDWVERNVSVKIKGKRVALKNEALKKVDVDTETYLKDHFCGKPFTTVEVTPSGLVYVCCPDWLPTPIGMMSKGLSELWKDKQAQALRASIIDGSFKYCSRMSCAPISARSLPRRDSPEAQAIIASFTAETGEIPPPKEVILSHDRSCNLSCPSCRTGNIVAGKSKQKSLDDLVETALLPTLRQAERVYITGSGDPFGSNHFRRLIKRLKRDEFPNLFIDLHTNGQLWDEKAWTDLDLAGRVDTAQISIDAAEEETYGVVRRGGTLQRLLKNLEFVKTLREAGEIRRLMISMVVQKLNYREMPDFVRLGKRFGADDISFQMIRNWGTYSTKEFEDIYIGDPAHPDHAGLAKVLEAPELTWPGVDVGNVRTHLRAAALSEPR